MVFNSNDGQDEGRERDKLLYHWTKDTPSNKVDPAEQIDDICLCDASINASVRLNTTIYSPQPPSNGQGDVGDESSRVENFESSVATNDSKLLNKINSDRRSLVLTFESTLIVIVEVEPELSIWMAVHVGLVPLAHEQPNAATLQETQQLVAGQLFGPHCVSSASIERIVGNIYSRFCLLNGTFQMIINDIKSNTSPGQDSEQIRGVIRERVRSICEGYFNNFLSDIHLNSIMTNIPSLYNFIVYLDLNPITLMRVNSFINHLVCIDAIQIRHTIAIFNDRLLWSSMNMYDTRLVYNYLVAEPIRDALQEELIKEMDKVRRIRDNMPIYLTDISDEQNNLEDSISALTITDGMKTKKMLSKLYLTVFRSSNDMTLGVFLKDAEQTELLQKCEQLLTSDSRLGVVPLASLAQSVGQNFLKANSISVTGNTPQASSLSNKKRLSSSSSSNKNQPPVDQKYLCFDRLSVSAFWSHNMDSGSQGKDQILLNTTSESGTSHEFTKNNRRSRLTKYILELQPELHQLKKQTRSGDVKEFLARTTSDTWLTVINSKYRSIYSIYRMRNVGLNEAQQYANNLSTSIISTRPRF